MAEGRKSKQSQDRAITLFEQKIKPYWRQVLWVVVLALLLAVVLYRFRESRRQLLAIGYSRLDSATSVEDLRSLALDYEGDQIGALAALRQGAKLMAEERFEEAASVFRRATEVYGAPNLVLPAWLGLAYALESQGDFAEAARSFQAAAEQPGTTANQLASAWCGVGRNLLAIGGREEARSAFERVLGLGEHGPYTEQARQFLQDQAALPTNP